MLYLQKGQISKVFLTLGEMTSLAAPTYLFIFENRGTNEQVKWCEQASGDVSLYPERYNAYNIDVSDKFATATPGTWIYKVYEQDSTTNLDPDLATGLVETGLMVLSPATRETPTRYTGSNNVYKAYTNE